MVSPQQLTLRLATHGPRLPGAGGRLLRLLDVCVEEVDAAGDVSSALFAELAPRPCFELVRADVYRSHVRELLARHRAGSPLDVATDAEVLLWLCDAVQNAPPDDAHAALYDRLFLRVVGEEAHAAVRAVHPTAPREPYPGACDEADARIRRGIVTARERRVS